MKADPFFLLAVVLVSPVSSVSVDCLRVGAVGGCGQNPDVNSTAETFPLGPHSHKTRAGSLKIFS